jgi:hypothetical protein
VAESSHVRGDGTTPSARIYQQDLRIKIVPVDCSQHLHHFSPDLFGFLIIFFHGSFDMAKAAFHPKRVSNELYRRDKLVCLYILQNLDILILFCSSLSLCGICSARCGLSK